MKNNVIFVYDDITMPGTSLKRVVGRIRYSQILRGRESLFEYTLKHVKNRENYNNIVRLGSKADYDSLNIRLDSIAPTYSVMHFLSSSLIVDSDEFEELLGKLLYAKEDMYLSDNNRLLAIYFSSVNGYKEFLAIKTTPSLEKIQQSGVFDRLHTEALKDISDYFSLIRWLSSGSNSRYFNKISGDAYEVVKSSMNVEKLRKEFDYYHLLPEEMKRWSVTPYNYVEHDNGASYTMQRVYLADIAVQWLHKSFTLEDFDQFLKEAFHYLGSRVKRDVAQEEYIRKMSALYIEKVKERITNLMESSTYPAVQDLMKRTKYKSFTALYEHYLDVYYKYVSTDAMISAKSYSLVVSHGDLCFSNILYDKEISMMMLIDPMGASTKEELWLTPCYDIVKLSHSICGDYDYINSGLFELVLDDELDINLKILRDIDNEPYMKLFKEYAEGSGFDYRAIRVLEVSLFLSMLSLHIESPIKVLGFIVNAIRILDEIESL